MDLLKTNDAVTRRIRAMNDRVAGLKENGLYFYNQAVEEMLRGLKSARAWAGDGYVRFL